MTQPSLLILAAGLGSRYGGLKQIDPLGPHGESIIDYSIYDARQAGFGRVVFVIRAEHERDFRQRFDCLKERGLDVAYVHQRMDDLPGGRACPQERVKPWGTGHAVYSARHVLSGSFGVIGADDFYGRDCFVKLHSFLAAHSAPRQWGMVVHRLGNTLPQSGGGVARGICRVENGMLSAITERTDIRQTEKGIVYVEDGVHHPLTRETFASMLVWGLHSSCFEAMEADFAGFLDGAHDPLKGEYYMPAFIHRQVSTGCAAMQVLETTARWYGVTYQADRPVVMDALAGMHTAGLYPALK